MQVYEALGTKSINFMDLNLGASSLYRISAPTTPPDARDEVIQRAEAGEMLACAEVKRVVQEKKAKLPSKQPRVASQTPTRRYPEPPEPADGENLWRSWGPGAAIGAALHDFGELVTGRDAAVSSGSWNAPSDRWTKRRGRRCSQRSNCWGGSTKSSAKEGLQIIPDVLLKNQSKLGLNSTGMPG
jgi:hypothetical protein